jgi:hypothetical protein
MHFLDIFVAKSNMRKGVYAKKKSEFSLQKIRTVEFLK